MIPRSIRLLLLCLLALATSCAVADALQVQRVSEHAYAIVGPTGNRTPENLGNNATFGFVVTDAGVVLIDSGGSSRGGAAIEQAIRQVTDQPVKVVINSGGQDHRWLGNGHFKALGARVIANRRAVDDQRARVTDQLFVLGNLIGSQLDGTEAVYADQTFDDVHDFELGGIRFELKHFGQAHTPGDSVIWLPAERVAFTGDIVYVERMLGIMSHSNSRSWIAAFNAMADLAPAVVVPGHGAPTDLARARADSLDYLVFLRQAVADFMDQGGDITQIGSLDQSRFAHLSNFDTLAGRNAQQVFQEMEWE